MLHEILLSLSGHPSPLFQEEDNYSSINITLSPPERALLKVVAHLSNIHCLIIAACSDIATRHKSTICHAVASSITMVHLAKFQAKVLDVEASILRKDAEIVGEYDIVPLTVIVDAFAGWTRRLEWLLQVCRHIQTSCTGPDLMHHLRCSMQTGYSDVEEMARQLTKVAETAWLKIATSWMLFGRLPAINTDDFLIRVDNANAGAYEIRQRLTPTFVTASAASSMSFIGKSLNQIRDKGLNLMSTSNSAQAENLKLLSSLTLPIQPATFTRVVTSLRSSLSQTTLHRLLPTSRILETLALLHDFFLLGRGEFAAALINESDEKTRNRWRRLDNPVYDKRDRLNDIAVKGGEARALISRTWTAMAALNNVTEEEAEQLELARDLITLDVNQISSTPHRPISSSKRSRAAASPFDDLLLAVPVSLGLRLPSPLDLFLTADDIRVYSHINSYLISIRRAYSRLANLWKATPLRRSHPAPVAAPLGSRPGGRAIIEIKRKREKARSQNLRTIWATSSAALFLLAETEAYFHGEVIEKSWEGFQVWFTGETDVEAMVPAAGRELMEGVEENDIWQDAGQSNTDEAKPGNQKSHDPQTLAIAHRACLSAISNHLLLSNASFTAALYHLLQQIDLLVSTVQRLQSIWSSLDLEADEGIIDAFVDLHQEETSTEVRLSENSEQVKQAIEKVVLALRGLDQDRNQRNENEWSLGEEDDHFVPRKVGNVDRLLIKLDFGDWFESKRNREGLPV